MLRYLFNLIYKFILTWRRFRQTTWGRSFSIASKAFASLRKHPYSLLSWSNSPKRCSQFAQRFWCGIFNMYPFQISFMAYIVTEYHMFQISMAELEYCGHSGWLSHAFRISLRFFPMLFARIFKISLTFQLPRRILGLMESIQVPVLRPSLSWSDVLVKSDIIHMFFKVIFPLHLVFRISYL